MPGLDIEKEEGNVLNDLSNIINTTRNPLKAAYTLPDFENALEAAKIAKRQTDEEKER